MRPHGTGSGLFLPPTGCISGPRDGELRNLICCCFSRLDVSWFFWLQRERTFDDDFSTLQRPKSLEFTPGRTARCSWIDYTRDLRGYPPITRIFTNFLLSLKIPVFQRYQICSVAISYMDAVQKSTNNANDISTLRTELTRDLNNLKNTVSALSTSSGSSSVSIQSVTVCILVWRAFRWKIIFKIW